MKILITGGHVTPALACIDELRRTKPETSLLFVGRKYTSDTDTEESFEYKEVVKRNVTFIPIHASRLTRFMSLKTVLNILLFPRGFAEAFGILRREKPDKIVSFGSYIALPVVCIAALLHIPVYTHDQAIHPGMTSRLISRMARKILVSFPEAASFFPKDKTQFIGNPVRKEVLATQERPFELPESHPVIFITGGSLGSHSINIHIEKILASVLERYTVIHQTGNVREYNDFERLTELRKTLPESQQARYIIRDHITSSEIGYIYAQADLVIARSGANTSLELIALKKPAILIPLPWAAHNEQYLHAELFKKAGAGEIFDQSKSSEALEQLIESMMPKLSEYAAHYSALEMYYNPHATEAFIQAIFET